MGPAKARKPIVGPAAGKAGRHQRPSRSVNAAHYTVDELDKHRYVAEVMARTLLIDEFPRITFQPQHDVLIQVFEEPRESRYVSVWQVRLSGRRR